MFHQPNNSYYYFNYFHFNKQKIIPTNMSQNKYHTLSDKKQLHRKKVRNIQLNTLFKQKRSSIANESSICKMDLQFDTRQIIYYNQKNENEQNYRDQVFFQNHYQRNQNIANLNQNFKNVNNLWNNEAELLKMNNNLNKYEINQLCQPYQQVNHKNQSKNILSNQKILQNFHKISPQNIYIREIQNNYQNFNNGKGLNFYGKNQLEDKIKQNEQKNKKLNVKQSLIIVNNKHQTCIKSPLNKNRQQNQTKLFNQASFKFRQINNKNMKDYFQKESIYKKKGNVKIFHKLLGRGTYGSVYQGYHQLLKFKVAVKEIQKIHIGASKGQIQCLQKLNNQHIIRLYQTFEDGNFIYLVLELATDNLRDYLKKLRKSNLHQDAIKQKHQNIAKMLILGMNYLHENGVIHRDLKFENVLINNQKIKICDFGLARTLSKFIFIQVINEGILDDNLQVQSVRCGTPYTMAPQLFFHSQNYKQRYTFKSDIFSLGVILHQMFYFYHPFDLSMTKLKALSRILIIKRFGWIDEIIDGALCEVRKRISWFEIMQVFKSCQVKQKQKNAQKQLKIHNKQIKNNQVKDINYEQSITFKETRQQKNKREHILKVNQIYQMMKIKQEVQHQMPEKQNPINNKNINNKIQIEKQMSKQMQMQPKLKKQNITVSKIQKNKNYQNKKSGLISNAIVQGYRRINETNKNAYQSKLKKFFQKNMSQIGDCESQKIYNTEVQRQSKVKIQKKEANIQIEKNLVIQKSAKPLMQAIMLMIIFLTVWSVICIQV